MNGMDYGRFSGVFRRFLRNGIKFLGCYSFLMGVAYVISSFTVSVMETGFQLRHLVFMDISSMETIGYIYNYLFMIGFGVTLGYIVLGTIITYFHNGNNLDHREIVKKRKLYELEDRINMLVDRVDDLEEFTMDRNGCCFDDERDDLNEILQEVGGLGDEDDYVQGFINLIKKELNDLDSIKKDLKELRNQKCSCDYKIEEEDYTDAIKKVINVIDQLKIGKIDIEEIE